MRRHGGRRWVRSEAGETLAEVVVSTVILGIVGVGIIGAIATVLISSDVDRSVSRAETVLRSYVAAVQAAPYAPCGGAGAYAPGSVDYTVPQRFDATVTGVAYWDGGPEVVAPPPSTIGLGSFGQTCGTDAGLQKIDLEVRSADQRAREQITIFKRNTGATP